MCRAWVGFLGVAFALFFATKSARADGFYVTITNSAGASTPRIAGAVFNATNASDAVANNVGQSNETQIHAVSQPGHAHLEIDAIAGSAGAIAAVVANPLVMGTVTEGTMKVEYTTPDASGQEQVYLVATFTTLMFTGWNTTYAAGTQTQVLDAEYLGETLAPPPAAKITRVIPKSAPAFQRLTIPRVTTLSVAHIDDAYFSFQGFAGESTAAGHAGQTRATSVTFSVMWQVVARKAGGVNGTITGFYLNQTQAKLNITKAMGSTTAAFISAQATHKTFGGTIQLVQHVGSSDIVRYTIQVQNALVLSDTTQASSSGQIETLGLVPSQAITVTDATTNASGRVE